MGSKHFARGKRLEIRDASRQEKWSWGFEESESVFKLDTGREIETVISLLLAETEEVTRLKREYAKELRAKDKEIERLKKEIKKLRRSGKWPKQ